MSDGSPLSIGTSECASLLVPFMVIENTRSRVAYTHKMREVWEAEARA
jgi:hypothetical protein